MRGREAICAQSRYKFEEKIPAGIQLASKLREESKKPIPDFIEFRVEIMSVTQPHHAELPVLTGLDSTVTSALEQNIFWVNFRSSSSASCLLFCNSIRPSGKPPSRRSTSWLPVRNDVLNKQREYINTPILRESRAAQQLLGKSSFNSGDSLSAGLPKYARSRIKAIADMLERE